MSEYKVTASPFGNGRIMWTGKDLAGEDFGFSLMQKFIQENKHEDWTLCIFDENTNLTVEILIDDIAEIPSIVSYVYNLEHAYPMYFVGENYLTESYMVGMSFAKGKIEPGEYKATNGKITRLTKKQ